MKHLLLSLVLLTATVTSFAQIRVACVGNSITYGHGIEDREHDTYPAQLQVLLGSDYDVRNFGVSGTTAQRQGDFPWVSTDEYRKAKEFLPQIVVIKLGTNDTKPQNWTGSERFINDLESLAREFAALPSQPRLVIALPAKAFEVRWDIRDEIIREGELKQISRMAKRNKWRLVDLYRPTSRIADCFPDGIHPNAQGAGVIASHVSKAVLKESKKLKK